MNGGGETSLVSSASKDRRLPLHTLVQLVTVYPPPIHPPNCVYNTHWYEVLISIYVLYRRAVFYIEVLLIYHAYTLQKKIFFTYWKASDHQRFYLRILIEKKLILTKIVF